LLDRAAERLRRAYHDGPIAPLRDVLQPDDVAGAYHLQSINTRYWVDQGRQIVGHKIGLTSKAVQAQLGVDQPDFGVLFADMHVVEGSRLDAARMIQPKVEAEVALVMGRDLNDPTATPQQVAAATDHACAALEIVDSRIADWRIAFADTVADNGSSAAFVLGREKKRLEHLDLYSCGMVLEIDGRVASLGAGAACLGHPLEAAAWLARTLSLRGKGLKAGDILLTGALGPMVPLVPGTSVRGRIGGLGEVAFTHVRESQ
jgi:2-keto-4-pentenoate hydratase